MRRLPDCVVRLRAGRGRALSVALDELRGSEPQVLLDEVRAHFADCLAWLSTAQLDEYDTRVCDDCEYVNTDECASPPIEGRMPSGTPACDEFWPAGRK